jgi:hypothetical protein
LNFENPSIHMANHIGLTTDEVLGVPDVVVRQCCVMISPVRGFEPRNTQNFQLAIGISLSSVIED